MPTGRPPRPRPPGGGAAGGWPLPLLLLLYCGTAAAVYHLGAQKWPGRGQAAAQKRLGDGAASARAAHAGGQPLAATSAAAQSHQPAAVGRRPAEQRNFLMFFSGHQGSSALMDMLAALPPVFVPGFEPLDSPGLSADQKLAFFEAVFSFPSRPADFPAWRAALAPPVPGLRVERKALWSLSQLAGKSVAGFKLRPFTHEAAVPSSLGQQPRSGSVGSSGSGSSDSSVGNMDSSSSDSSVGSMDSTSSGTGQQQGIATAPTPSLAAAATPAGSSNQRGHTALTGLDPAAVRELLHRHNVSVLLTLRRNAVKEALSWHKARDLGVSQFNELRAARAAQAGSSGSKAGGTASGQPVKGDGGTQASRQAVAQRLLQAAGDKEAAQLAARADEPALAGGRAGSTQVSGSRLSSHDGGPAAGNQAQPAVQVDMPRLLHWLNYTARVNAELQAAVAYYSRPTHTVWYEDFLADPLGEARRAAAFIGVPPAAAAQLQPSAKFRKAGPDALQDSVANFGELCTALEGTPNFAHLDAAACAAARRLPAEHSAGQSGQSGKSGGSSAKAGGGSDAGGSGSASGSNTVDAAQPTVGLHSDWCLPQDQQVSGWAGLSPAECSRRAEAAQAAAAAAVRAGNGTLLFKHVHKAGGSTLCKLAHLNMAAESPKLPGRSDWDTNCVPYEAFLGQHPAVGTSAAAAGALLHARRGQGGEGGRNGAAQAAGTPAAVEQAAGGAGDPAHASLGGAAATGGGRRLNAFWLGGACWLGFLTPPQLRALPQHYAPLTFVASEGPLPEALPLDNPRLAMVTMLRRPVDRTLSSYHWWRFMLGAMPQSPAECHAYSAPTNATLEQWLRRYPDNWQVRELLGRSALYDWRRRPLTDADLLAAQKRLHAFTAVLLLEQPASSMALMQRRLGWRHVDWQGERAGSRHGSNAEAELAGQPAVLELLRQQNRLDERLYEYAVALHAAQVQQLGSGT